MPLLSRWIIKLAFGYLLAGLSGLAVYQANAAWDFGGTWYAFRPVGLHLVTVGWLTQLIFAVMFWMFPIISRQQPRGKEWLARAGFAVLNIGLLMRVFFEVGMSWGLPADAGWGLAVSAILQWIGASWLVVNAWPRIRAHGGNK